MTAKKILSAAIGALALAGCAVTPNSGSDGLYARPIGNAPVTPNPTPYSEALCARPGSCFAACRGGPDFRLHRCSGR